MQWLPGCDQATAVLHFDSYKEIGHEAIVEASVLPFLRFLAKKMKMTGSNELYIQHVSGVEHQPTNRNEPSTLNLCGIHTTFAHPR